MSKKNYLVLCRSHLTQGEKDMKIIMTLGLVIGIGMGSAAQVSLEKISYTNNEQGKIELIAHGFCHRHRHHPDCHHRHHRKPVKPFWLFKYDDRFNRKMHKCRHHPDRKSCRRFCDVNPRVCYG